jgi:hypothetical protein
VGISRLWCQILDFADHDLKIYLLKFKNTWVWSWKSQSMTYPGYESAAEGTMLAWCRHDRLLLDSICPCRSWGWCMASLQRWTPARSPEVGLVFNHPRAMSWLVDFRIVLLCNLTISHIIREGTPSYRIGVAGTKSELVWNVTPSQGLISVINLLIAQSNFH